MQNDYQIEGGTVQVIVPHKKTKEDFIFELDLDDLSIVQEKASWGMDKNKTSAVANFRQDGKMCKVTMHRLLTGWKNVNFADGNRFNLRRSNMVEGEVRKRRRKTGQNLKGNEFRIQPSHAEIIIRGKHSGVVLIDRADVALASEYTWNINPRHGYVQARTRGGRQGSKTVLLHRMILGEDCEGSYVDHVDGNKLNNRRKNLRPCTNSENLHNRKALLKSSSPNRFRGVSPSANGFMAQIHINGTRHQKYFQTFDEAKAQRIKWEKELNPSGLYK